MIRLLHTSDSHWDARGRLQDCIDVHRAMLEIAKRERVDAILHAGDFFDRRSAPEERTALADWLKAAAEIAPVVGCKGNHDVAGDLEIFPRLRSKHPIYIVERVTAEPGSAVMVELAGGRSVGVLGMAWIDKAHLVAQLDATTDAEQTRQMTIAGMRNLLTCLRAEAARVRRVGAVPIMVAHVMIGGSMVSTGQTLIGVGPELSAGDLADIGAAYVACGHIHAAQEFYGGRVAYSGSPVRHTFGETEAKGVRLVTIDDAGELVSNEFRELPARRMVLIEEDWTDGDAVRRISGTDDVAGALVRWRYHVRAEDLHLVDTAAIERGLLAAGAHEVKIEAVIDSEVRVRSEEIVRTESLADKLEAYWRAKGVEVDEATRGRVHSKLADLEARP